MAEIKERELMSKKLSKYISFFDCFDKTLIVLGDCNGTRTHNHLVHKRTLNHLAKLAK